MKEEKVWYNLEDGMNADLFGPEKFEQREHLRRRPGSIKDIAPKLPYHYALGKDQP
jgi:hypothetical protein